MTAYRATGRVRHLQPPHPGTVRHAPHRLAVSIVGCYLLLASGPPPVAAETTAAAAPGTPVDLRSSMIDPAELAAAALDGTIQPALLPAPAGRPAAVSPPPGFARPESSPTAEFTSLDTRAGSGVIHYPDNRSGLPLFTYPTAIGVADLNADGIGDVIINDIFQTGTASPSPLSPGEIHVVFGPIDAHARLDLQSATVASVRIVGRGSGELLMSQVGIGELTGDHKTDLVLLAPTGDGPGDGRLNSGEAYILRGPLTAGVIDLAATPPLTTIYGDGVVRTFAAVAIGDVSGDGRPDLVLAGDNATYVLFGPLPAGEIDLLTRPPDVALVASDAFGVGGSVNLADLDGDGTEDILVAAYRADGPVVDREDCGQALIFRGPFGAGMSMAITATSADTVVYGANSRDYLDRVATGDLNGDGYDDLLVAARGDGPDDDRPDAGEVHVLFGPLTGRTTDLAAAGAGLTIYGATAGDFLHAAHIVDLTGDGVDDLVLGAMLADGDRDSRPDAGEVYVFHGPLDAAVAAIDLASVTPALTMQGPDGKGPGHGGDWFGYALASGNLAGDGRVALLVGAAMSQRPDDPSRTSTGEVHVIDNWALMGGDYAPEASSGGPYPGICSSGVLGIWLDATGSFDAETPDHLTYEWSTDCPGTITSPSQPLTEIRIDCVPCRAASCMVAVRVTDPAGAADIAKSRVIAGVDGGLCASLDNSLRLVDDADGVVQLEWDLVAGVDRYEVSRAADKPFSLAHGLTSGAGSTAIDDTTDLAPTALYLYRVAGRKH